MAYVDGKLLYSDAQALSATAVSTNVVDHVNNSKIGMGEPLVVEISADVASVGAGSYVATLQTSVDEAFTSPIAVASAAIPTATALGTKYFIDIPANAVFEKYTRINYVLTGSLTITVTSDLKPKSMVDAYFNYASGFTVA